jgi:ElaB/YqjD/DUF883 family membrane-anchored ribosome-binding protein
MPSAPERIPVRREMRTGPRKIEGELMKDFRNLIRDGEALLRSTSNLSGEASRRRASNFAFSSPTHGRASPRRPESPLKRAAGAVVTDDYVHANPWPAIGVAAGVGFVLGALFARR